MRSEQKRTGLYCAYGVMAAFYLFMAFCVPYCHDDWDWGLQVGMTQWLQATLNSRYVGNFFVIIMTRSAVIKTLVMALTLFFIPVLMTALSGKQSVERYLFSNLLILAVPQLMWQQTYGWVSAFANYVISAALTLLLILLLEKTVKKRSKRSYLMLPLVLAAALFTENLTVYLFCAISLFSLACFIKTRRVNPLHICLIVAAAVGGVIMFSGELYGVLLREGTALEGIRSLSFDPGAGFIEIILSWAERFLCDILPPLIFGYPWLISLLTAALILGAAASKKPAKNPTPFFLSVIIALALCIYSFIGVESRELNAVLAVVFIAAVSLIIARGFEKSGKMLFLWLSAPSVLLPLIVTTEIGQRLYYLPYVLVATVAVSALPERLEGKVRDRAFTGVLALALLACAVVYGRIYWEIRGVTANRQQAIDYAVENKLDSVIMEKDENKYWWGRNPASKERIVFFKEFYGIPEDMEVVFEE